MTVKLTSNFFGHARGVTFKDTASATWAINPNTNEISVTTGGGTVGSVGLSDGSTTPIYTIAGSPVTGSGTLTFTLSTQTANKVFAGPGSGGATQPTFRSLVLADIPTGYPYANLSGAPSVPVGANPSANVGLSAVNGVAGTWMRSDGAPAIDQTIAPTWTAEHIFTVAGNAVAVKNDTGLFNVRNTANTNVSQWGTVKGWTAAGVNVTDTALGAIGTLNLYGSGSSTATISLTGTQLGFFGTVPAYTKVTGWGTPTGPAVVNNFSGTAATLVQCSNAIAKIITDLKAMGIYGA